MGERELPKDPNDVFYLTNCYACSAVAKPDQEYIKNYGGTVCFSCRAFFRRQVKLPTSSRYYQTFYYSKILSNKEKNFVKWNKLLYRQKKFFSS